LVGCTTGRSAGFSPLAAWLRRYDKIPPRKKFRSMILSCDPAGKADTKNDYTAITLVGRRALILASRNLELSLESRF
jgi:hypothetical protein